MTHVGKLIDGAMRAGANTINRLAFTLKDEHSAQVQALRLASTKAKAKAEEMASALGLKVVRVLGVTEGERGVRPIIMPQGRGLQVEAAAAAPTPIETLQGSPRILRPFAGTIEVRSSVTLTAEVAAR